MELSAKLTSRDGSCQPFRVSCERTLKGLLGGLERLQGQVTAELSRLVERERGAAATTGGGEPEGNDDDDDDEEDDDSDEDDSDDDSEEDNKNGILTSSPPAKRQKT